MASKEKLWATPKVVTPGMPSLLSQLQSSSPLIAQCHQHYSVQSLLQQQQMTQHFSHHHNFSPAEKMQTTWHVY
eukprot:12523160-Ditylum_brightwellii.AAC.2